jgi:voltage-gated potassium channel
MILLGVLLTGTLGYYLIEDNWTILESFYMTVITLSTIGFSEVRELSPQGRIFTVLMIIAGIGLVATLLSRLGQMVIESGLNRTLRRRRVLEKVKRLSGHYVLCGFGRIGSSIARKLNENAIDFVVIESDEGRYESIHGQGFLVILGDASEDGTLIAAGIERAKGTILCIPDDATNVNIALAARSLNPDQHIFARGSNPSKEYRLIRAGADTVVYPFRLGGEQIARLIATEKGNSIEDTEAGTLSILGYELKVYKNHVKDQSIAEIIKEKHAVRPVAVRHEDGTMTHNVKPDFEVLVGESVLLLVNQDSDKEPKSMIVELEWSDELSLGVAQIDDEHRKLFSYAKKFQEAALEGRGQEEVSKLLSLLVDYTETHFHAEEELMKAHKFPGLNEHHMKHQILTQKVIQLHKSKNYIYEDSVWEFLNNWLRDHILIEDKAFAIWMHQDQEEELTSLEPEP